MKKIVAYVSPLTASDSTKDFVEGEDNVERITKTAPPPSPLEGEGTVKFEAVLSDEQMQRVVDTLLHSEEKVVVTESLIGELLQSEMEHYSAENPSLLNRVLEEIEQKILGQTFEKCNRVKTKTASCLGIDRNTLHKKLLKYGLIEGERE